MLTPQGYGRLSTSPYPAGWPSRRESRGPSPPHVGRTRPGCRGRGRRRGATDRPRRATPSRRAARSGAQHSQRGARGRSRCARRRRARRSPRRGTGSARRPRSRRRRAVRNSLLRALGVVRSEADDHDGRERPRRRGARRRPRRRPADSVVRVHAPARQLLREVRLDPDVERVADERDRSGRPSRSTRRRP